MCVFVFVCVCLCSYKCARAGSQTHMPHSHAVAARRPCSSGSFDSSTTWSMLTVNCLRLLCVLSSLPLSLPLPFVIINTNILQRFDWWPQYCSTLHVAHYAAGRWHVATFASLSCACNRQRIQFERKAQFFYTLLLTMQWIFIGFIQI